MNCSNWEERLALYAGGDLSAAGVSEVEQHLAECAGCQMFAAGLRQSLQTIREAHAEELRPADFAAVRARVLSQIAKSRAPWWRRGWIYGFGAAAAALILYFAMRPAPQPVAVHHPPAPVVVQPEPSAPAPVPLHVEQASTRPHTRQRPRHLVAAARPHVRPRIEPEAHPALTIKLLTDDPDVVIYWITEQTGEPR